MRSGQFTISAEGAVGLVPAHARHRILAPSRSHPGGIAPDRRRGHVCASASAGRIEVGTAYLDARVRGLPAGAGMLRLEGVTGGLVAPK